MNAVDRADRAYPERLRGVPDAPATLHVRGVWPDRRPVLALVGARAASGHGIALARELASDLARAGALVISGGAVGIDAAAHRGALEVGAPTVAVLATGLDAPYPAHHRPLFDAIVAGGGALVTPFQPGVPLRRWHFPRRNQVMAGLADAVLVVEAAVTSGSLYTAQAARRYGRLLAACPGTAGANALLCQGAALVRSAGDLLAALAGAPRRLELAAPEAGSDEARALAELDPADARGVDEVSARSGLEAHRVMRALCALELEGLALVVPGGRWIRSSVHLTSPQYADT